MPGLQFFPIDVYRDSDHKWRESNRALHQLIRLHKATLGEAVSIAEGIRELLKLIFPLMDELRLMTCPWCPEPCCIVNKVWFDFRDLLFLHLIEARIPPAQLTSQLDETCRYLTHKGCRLPRITHPWACTLYICGTQMRNLVRMGRCIVDDFNSTIRTIRTERLAMEDAFIQALK
jgi:hypothetical protein